MHTLARVSRASHGDDYQWAVIRDSVPRNSSFGNSSHASAFVGTSNRPRARLSRPPNLPFPVPAPFGVSPPTTPLPIGRGQSHRSVTAIRPPRTDSRRPSVRPISTVDETEVLGNESTRLNSNEGLRTGEVARLPRLKNRISTVSQYPVLVGTGRESLAPSIDGRLRTRSRRRPVSIASTSTTGIYLAVGALPGSEPFDLSPPTQDLLSRHDGRLAHTHAVTNPARHRPSSLLPPMPGTERRSSHASSGDGRHGGNNAAPDRDRTHRYSLVSRLPTNYAASDLSGRSSVSLCVSVESDDGHDTRAQVRAGSESAQPEIDPRHIQWLHETAPTPPEKDAKHLPPLPKTLRTSSSVPNLQAVAPATARAGVVRERSGTWYGQPVTMGRDWLSTLTGRAPNRHSQAAGKQPQPQKQQQEKQPKQQKQQQRRGSSGRAATRPHATVRTRRAHLLALWSRITRRPMPRSSVQKQSS